MNILFVHWLDGIGGGEKYIINLSENLPEKYKVSFIGRRKDCILVKNINRKLNYYYTPFVRNLWVFPTFSLKLFIKVFKVIKKDKIDIVHLNDIYLLPTFLVIRLFFPKIKLFFTSHGRWDTYFIFNKLLIKLVKFKKIITATPVQYFRIKDVCDNVILLPFLVKKIEKNSKTINSKKIRLGLVGRFSPVKNHLFAFEIIKNLNNKFELHVFGEKILDINEERDEYRQKVLSFRNNNKITFHGFIENENKIYENIDILIVTSKSESFSMVTIEALSKGIPVVSTLTEGSSFLIWEGFNGFICNDLKSFCKAINNIVNNYEFFSKNALISAKRFDKKTYLSEIEKIYNE